MDITELVTLQNDENYVREFSSYIKLVAERHEVALPWKRVDLQLATSEAVAKKRLVNLTKKAVNYEWDDD